MSCASTTCSPTLSFSMPAVAYARPGFSAFPWREFLHAAIKAVARFRTRRAERFALMELDDRLLADIGITRQQARREARRRFWQ
jgi:uncharacterized protein YjiS (DUF1127 family)